MAKYNPLYEWLRLRSAAGEEKVETTFGEIEEILGNSLPKSAREHRPWWGNDKTHDQATDGWMAAGWRVGQVDIDSEQVTFKYFELDDHGRRHQIDSLVKWFHENYEDPAHHLPYISSEGGYQWIFGPPCNAHEALSGSFPEESEEIILAAVKEIESDGLYEWVSRASISEDFPFFDEKDPALSGDLQEIATELDSLIADLPAPQVYPAFSIGDDGVLHFISPPDLQATPSEDPLFGQLKTTAHDLGQELIGSNAYTALSGIVEQYNQALSDEQISISHIYALGIKLENVASATKRSIEAEDLPAFPLNVEHNLVSTLKLHGTYIMLQEKGRNLAEATSAYSQPPQQIENLREAGKQIVASIANHPDLFKGGVEELIASDVEDIGRGEQPERSNQTAVTTLYNLGLSMLRGIGGMGAAGIIGALAGGAFVASIPGVAGMALGTDVINTVWHFLLANLSSFETIAGFTAFDTSWITRFSDLLGRLKELIKPR